MQACIASSPQRHSVIITRLKAPRHNNCYGAASTFSTPSTHRSIIACATMG